MMNGWPTVVWFIGWFLTGAGQWTGPVLILLAYWWDQEIKKEQRK